VGQPDDRDRQQAVLPAIAPHDRAPDQDQRHRDGLQAADAAGHDAAERAGQGDGEGGDALDLEHAAAARERRRSVEPDQHGRHGHQGRKAHHHGHPEPARLDEAEDRPVHADVDRDHHDGEAQDAARAQDRPLVLGPLDRALAVEPGADVELIGQLAAAGARGRGRGSRRGGLEARRRRGHAAVVGHRRARSRSPRLRDGGADPSEKLLAARQATHYRSAGHSGKITEVPLPGALTFSFIGPPVPRR